jgi:serine/threonine-protein kinase
MLIADRYKGHGDSLAGGMGTIWLCRDVVLERSVAIKVMPGNVDQRRMRDELGALLRMRSKHVVQVYDVLRTSAGALAIVEEYVDGKDLLDEANAPKSARDFLKTIWQIASGIAEIHSLDVIHRDIKPNNIQIDREGVVKIFDFGLARDEGPEAETVGFVGTHGFAAPELYAQRAKFTAAVDTYAFGATALFVARRELPAEMGQRPPVCSISNHFAALPFDLADEVAVILNSCLKHSAADRPPMKEVRDTLAKYLLRDRHKALVVFEGNASYLDANRRSVRLRLPSMGEVTITYDGLGFRVESVSGDVFANNRRIAVGDELPGACVVALGAPEQGNRRRYITFDLSHPEIVL